MPDKALKVRGNDPRFTETVIRGDTRQIEVRIGTSASAIWQWKTDGVKVVVFYDANNHRYEAKVYKVLGMSEPDWIAANEALLYEEDRIPITPADILDYIKTKIIPTPEYRKLHR